MSPRHASPTRPRAARHAHRVRRHPLLRVGALACTALLAFGVAGGATAYVAIENNISTADVSHLTGDRPVALEQVDPDDPNAGRALNYLIMGSDVRDGENAEIGGRVEGMRSDTTILVHISAGRDRVEMVSIPRDSHVDIPACDRSDGTTSNPRTTRFNEAFSIGSQSGEVSDAAACTIKTVQTLTGVPVDGWVVVDFAGFISMVDALGGIPMCIPQDMRSPKAGLDLEAGRQVLDGPTALAFARARTGAGLGDGSDLSRLGRQQEMLAATANEVLDKNLLTDFTALYRFLTAATRSLTTDPVTGNIPQLAGLAFSLRAVPSDHIYFMTVPYAAYPDDPNQVVWTDEAEELFRNMQADRPIVPEPEPEPSPTAAPEPGESPTAGPGVDPTDEPTPDRTPRPGREPITADDVTAVCG